MPLYRGVTDHGALSGLSDDDHTNYRREDEDHTHASTGAQGGTVAHSALTGLTTGDPHTQYRLETDNHTHASSGAQGGTVAHSDLTGLTTGDPHTQYRREDEDHTHASTGAQGGTIDHGALTGLSDDDHTQYLKETDVAAKGDLYAGTANDTVGILTAGSNGQMLTAQSGQTTGLQWANVWTKVEFSKTGTLTTGTGTMRWYNDTGRTLTFSKVRASVGTAPTGQSILCDVHLGGTTIWSTQGNRVAVAASANTGTSSTFDTTTLADGSYLTVDIDQIGSGTAGADLTVVVWMTG